MRLFSVQQLSSANSAGFNEEDCLELKHWKQTENKLTTDNTDLMRRTQEKETLGTRQLATSYWQHKQSLNRALHTALEKLTAERKQGE